MCRECGCNPCLSGCPNFVPKKVFTCEHCGEDICEGEPYVEIDGLSYHEDCFESEAANILIEQYGATKRIAR